ncbi:hypothetical protein MC885_019601 [Smutsia gigantea]|nr:hypothetical protein MC885_019601 [Smutsia gigantea]
MLRRPLAGLVAAALGRVPSDGMSGLRPVVLSGPSGAGKSTLLKRLLQEHSGIFGFSVSHTTRDPRPGEENGKGELRTWLSSGVAVPPDRWPLLQGMSQGREGLRDPDPRRREVMQQDIAAGDFIEHAEFSGNLYGTSKAAVRAVQAMNRICVLDVDLQGVHNIKKTDLRPICIFVQPPSLDVLEQRLRLRNTETEESLSKRLAAARADMESSKEPGLFELIIVNDNLDKAYHALEKALLEVGSSLCTGEWVGLAAPWTLTRSSSHPQRKSRRLGEAATPEEAPAESLQAGPPCPLPHGPSCGIWANVLIKSCWVTMCAGLWSSAWNCALLPCSWQPHP